MAVPALHRLRLLLVALLLGCDGEAPTAVAPASGLDGSWISALVRSPATFATLMDSGREGWIAFHKNDWMTAAKAPGAVGTRACSELAAVHRVLSNVSTTTWLRLGDTWEKRGTLPAGSLFPRVVALAALDAGQDEAAARWNAMAAPELQSDRGALHEGLRTGHGDIDALRTLARDPLVTESTPSPDGKAFGATTRIFYDPRVHLTLATAYERCAGEPIASPIERRIFSAQLGAEDDPGVLGRMGVVFPAGADDTEACREAVRALDTVLDPWKLALGTEADDDGRALLNDLRLVEGARARVLTAAAVEALGADRPRCALAYAEMAMDHESSRAVNPINSPTLFAVLAAADLRTGRTREALDALEVLTGPFPETQALDETVGDLAVLEGIDRAGDSREN